MNRQLTPRAEEDGLRRLRVMIVDDNHINLTLLERLLNRRFAHLLEEPPTAVDSALKAIQLLRHNVYDCIFMDIQMPLLSGLEASVRIRKAEDNVLSINSGCHIVAVTTVVGTEPEAAYRRARMDGMISKPVRHIDIDDYLSPLAKQAHMQASQTSMVNVNGITMMPPLPRYPGQSNHAFYLPFDARLKESRPDICMASNFKSSLRSQTRASLRNLSADIVAQMRESATHDSFQPFTQFNKGVSHPSIRRHHTISCETFRQQVAREIASLNSDSGSSDEMSDVDYAPTQIRHGSKDNIPVRHTSVEKPLHSVDGPEYRESPPGSAFHGAAAEIAGKLQHSTLIAEQSSDPYPPQPMLGDLRRDSMMSSSDSNLSDSSTDLTTPCSEKSLTNWSIDTTIDEKQSHYRRSGSADTVDPTTLSSTCDFI